MTLYSPNLKVILFTTYYDVNIAFLFEYFREYFVSGCNGNIIIKISYYIYGFHKMHTITCNKYFELYLIFLVPCIIAIEI